MRKILRAACRKTFSKTLGPMAILAAVLVPAVAMALPNTTQMTCRQAATIVRAGGSAVLATSANTYDRYVISRAFCPADQINDPAWVPTRDNPRCFVGYTCYDPTRDLR
ncbi:hypothetical protein GCM10007301_44140 [Azorhizobium oxalatiphilum]|uniref:Uncharacterized protein n=1 Tax=Azorhizobium oxalatiphilum TaxID=980631 RepID=A0A917FG88_9HYPH|nr:hypothetical protein [Azorhizobium oxalatiphilum]GGF79271.1 hypothetical protein GCM10007301_44140 [Azorhizobium oxalatiphilum]